MKLAREFMGFTNDQDVKESYKEDNVITEKKNEFLISMFTVKKGNSVASLYLNVSLKMKCQQRRF